MAKSFPPPFFISTAPPFRSSVLVMSSADAPTPMMAQYQRIKSGLPADALLLFRLGDFYEMFLDDARISAPLLDIALTHRGGQPMCGIPHHAASLYIAKLLKAGRKVALCEQVGEAKPGKLVERTVTQILSPGSHLDEKLLTAERNHYLAAINPGARDFGLAVLDLTTGEFRATHLADIVSLCAELERLRPAEVLHPAGLTRMLGAILPQPGIWHEIEDCVFGLESATHTLCAQYQVGTLDGFGLRDQPSATGAAGAVLCYLGGHLRRDLSHLRPLRFYTQGSFLQMDAAALRHLEILEPLQRDAPREATLFGVLNHTATPMGARCLRDWLARPLASTREISCRQRAVQALIDGPGRHASIRERLGPVRDLERTATRLCAGSGNARDLRLLQQAIEALPDLKGLIAQAAHDGLTGGADPDAADNLLAVHSGAVEPLPDLADLLRCALVDEPPASVKEGGFIREGFDPTLDELRSGAHGGKSWIAQLQHRESERTGIGSLKVRFNNIFGYYIEVTKAHLDKVPAEYRRKQTVSGGERYTTDELDRVETQVLGAQERCVKLEYELFLRLREAVLSRLASLQRTAEALAATDALSALAEAARMGRYCRPEVRDDACIDIRAGRHPVLEQSLRGERFVPNDTSMDTTARQIALITGPNMAGKSTYLRQVALLVVMAHIGSFVPATSARVGLTDRIFTRIGASDDLARGQSTFMVEMAETAHLLHHATRRSCILLDEIGRGTSTFDGLSLAWAIVEHLHHQVGARTLFATHYHELTELAGRLPRVFNLNAAVREWNDQIVFLRTIAEGAADQSYGIQVARLAGLPAPVLKRAREILGNLEETSLTPAGGIGPARTARSERRKLKALPPSAELDLFT